MDPRLLAYVIQYIFCISMQSVWKKNVYACVKMYGFNFSMDLCLSNQVLPINIYDLDNKEKHTIGLLSLKCYVVVAKSNSDLKILVESVERKRFFFIEILSLSITGRIFGHFTGRVHGLGCGLEVFLGLDFIITS